MGDILVCYNIHQKFRRLYWSRNVSYNSLPTIECVLMVYCLPVICLLGFILNIFCVALFCRVWILRRFGYVRSFRRSLTLTWSLVPYLIALSLFDAVQLILSVFILFFPAVLSHTEQQVRKTQFSSFINFRNVVIHFIWMFYPVCMTANYASIWTISVICVQRYFAVCHPVRSRRYDWLRKGKTAILVVVALALCLNLVRYWEHGIQATTVPHQFNLSSTTVYFLAPNSLQKNFTYKLIFEGIIYVLSMYILPFLLLVIMNSRILWTIHKSKTANLSNRQRREQRSSRMVCAVVLMFFLCHTLSPITRWWSLINADVLVNSDPTHVVWLLEDLSNVLINLNCAANPLIYCFFTRKFKDLFAEMKRLRLAKRGFLVFHGQEMAEWDGAEEARPRNYPQGRTTFDLVVAPLLMRSRIQSNNSDTFM